MVELISGIDYTECGQNRAPFNLGKIKIDRVAPIRLLYSYRNQFELFFLKVGVHLQCATWRVGGQCVQCVCRDWHYF